MGSPDRLFDSTGTRLSGRVGARKAVAGSFGASCLRRTGGFEISSDELTVVLTSYFSPDIDK
jgi:hypothetical protein